MEVLIFYINVTFNNSRCFRISIPKFVDASEIVKVEERIFSYWKQISHLNFGSQITANMNYFYSKGVLDTYLLPGLIATVE